MGRYDIFSLTEEQMAAYLDGMLNDEQSNMVEELIASDEDLLQIQDALDAVDSTFIALDPAEEVPLECLADDFVLPEIPSVDDILHDHDGEAYSNDDPNHDIAYSSDDVNHDVTDDESGDGYDVEADGTLNDSDSDVDNIGDDYGYGDGDF